MVPELINLEEQPAVARVFHLPINALADLHLVQADDLKRRIVAAGGQLAGPHFRRYVRFTEEGRLEVQVGFPVLEPIAVGSGAVSIFLSGGKAASIAHFGDYSLLPGTHAQLDRWVEEGGWQPSGARWEVFLTSPAAEPDSSRWITRLFQPVS